MGSPTSNRLKRKHEVKDERPFWKVVVQGIVSGVARYACSKLCNERSWHFLAVKFPEWCQWLWDVLKP
ncbi:hypothetical protein R75471_00412 [Paraburkholderia domus]|nr:hypothetical protein R75471_00412 [Paraburkholderia domus]